MLTSSEIELCRSSRNKLMVRIVDYDGDILISAEEALNYNFYPGCCVELVYEINDGNDPYMDGYEYIGILKEIFDYFECKPYREEHVEEPMEVDDPIVDFISERENEEYYDSW